MTTFSLGDWLNFSIASIEAEKNVYRIGSWTNQWLILLSYDGAACYDASSAVLNRICDTHILS